MITIIIPLMPVEPYTELVKGCFDSLNQQSGVEFEVLVCKQKVKRYINKNALLNEGLSMSRGEYVFFCDADFRLDDRFLLAKMESKVDEDFDVVFPMFMSETHKKLKIADGAVFARSDLFNGYKLNETLEGISWVTFPFLKWCLDNVNWYCGNDIVITVDQSYKSRKKRHNGTSAKMRPIYKEVVNRLKAEGVWP